MRLGILVQRERELKGWSQRELARRAGVSSPAITRLEHGERMGRVDTVLRITKALGMDPDVVQRLMAGEVVGVPEIRSPQEILAELQDSLSHQRKVITLVVTQQPASAGYGETVEAETVQYVPEPGLENHQYLAVPVSGNCLEPDLPPGSIAIVDQDAEIHDGDPVLAVHEGEYLLKWLELRGEEHWLVANQGRDPMKANGSTTILGVIVSSVKKIRRRRR